MKRSSLQNRVSKSMPKKFYEIDLSCLSTKGSSVLLLRSFKSATTLSIITLCIKVLYVTPRISDIQHSNHLPLCWLSLCWVSHFIYDYDECYNTECHYVECHYAEKCGVLSRQLNKTFLKCHNVLNFNQIYYHFISMILNFVQLFAYLQVFNLII